MQASVPRCAQARIAAILGRNAGSVRIGDALNHAPPASGVATAATRHGDPCAVCGAVAAVGLAIAAANGRVNAVATLRACSHTSQFGRRPRSPPKRGIHSTALGRRLVPRAHRRPSTLIPAPPIPAPPVPAPPIAPHSPRGQPPTPALEPPVPGAPPAVPPSTAGATEVPPQPMPPSIKATDNHPAESHLVCVAFSVRTTLDVAPSAFADHDAAFIPPFQHAPTSKRNPAPREPAPLQRFLFR